MSGDDDIQFDDVRYREPVRLRRPDRDRTYAAIAYEVPGPDDLPIFLDHEVADRIERHALSDTTVELGGIILGRECVDDQTGKPFVWVSQMIEAKHFENTQASFTYTHDSWQEITRERDRQYPDLDIVGWYHTHPDFGIFLSGHDQFIHQNFFAQALQVAYVVDPIRQTRGFFVWREGKLAQVGGYFIVAPRSERPALARVVDELEGIEPEAATGGSALSPRLEAELIDMLRRPPDLRVASPTDRGQTAAVFSLLGMVLGALGVALALWIGALSQQVRVQTASLAELGKSLDQSKAVQLLSRREAVVEAKEAALAGLLREVRVGGEAGDYIGLYQKAVAERDQAIVRAATLEQVGRDLVDKDATIMELRQALESGEKAFAEASKDRKELEKLRLRAEAFDASAAKMAKLKKAAEDLAAMKDGTLPIKYDRAWYAAVASGVVCLLLGLGLVAALARGTPPESARRTNGLADPQDNDQDLRGPTVRIGETPR